jgi:hypothetical protein
MPRSLHQTKEVGVATSTILSLTDTVAAIKKPAEPFRSLPAFVLASGKPDLKFLYFVGIQEKMKHGKPVEIT